MAVQKSPGTKTAQGKGSRASAKGGQRKNPSGTQAKPAGKPSGKPRVSFAVLLWLAFAIFIFGFFLFNRENISKSFRILQDALTLGNLPIGGTVPPSPDESAPPEERTVPAPGDVSVSPFEPVLPAEDASPPSPPEAAPQTGVPEAGNVPETVQAAESAEPARDTEAPHTTAPARTEQSQTPPQSAQNTAELRDRTLYFTQVDRGGSILRVKTDRKLPVSDSPMTDVLKALVAGPNGDEQGKGLLSLIPPASRILSATVRGNTAYINFSEDFQYNTYGVEGYAGQLRQIVFTVTEFPNVRDVQILIEGQRVDYLGEGIWIGSPLSRDML